MTFTNKLELACFGMRRSGNHALLNWIKRQVKGEFVHINNAKIDGSHDPYVSFSEFVVSGMNPLVFEKSQRKFKRFAKYLLYRGNVEYIYGRHDLDKLNIEELRCYPKSLLIHSYEHYSLKRVLGDWFDTELEEYLGKSQSRFNVVLLRDPYNLFASLIKKGERFSRPQSIINKWNEHAREYLGYTNYLSHRVGVSYNSWFKDVEYREEIAQHLGLDFTDAGLNSVPLFGRGSSFDGQKYNFYRKMKRTRRRKVLLGEV